MSPQEGHSTIPDLKLERYLLEELAPDEMAKVERALDKAIEILHRLAKEDERVLDDPAVTIAVNALADSPSGSDVEGVPFWNMPGADAAETAADSADDLGFDGLGLIMGQSALLFCADNQVNGGLGNPLNDGLRCAGCVNRTERALRDAPGVTEAHVNYTSHRALVSFDELLDDREPQPGTFWFCGYVRIEHLAD